MAEFTKPGLSSIPVAANPDVVIEMVLARPILNATFQQTRPPGQVVGYFNKQLDAVELFVVGQGGNRWYKCS